MERAREHPAALLRVRVEPPLGPPVRLGDELGVEVDDVVDGVGVGLLEEARERGVAVVVSDLAEPVGARISCAVGERLAEARPHPRQVDVQRARCPEGAELLGLGQQCPWRGRSGRLLECLEWRAALPLLAVDLALDDEERVERLPDRTRKSGCGPVVDAVEDLSADRTHGASDGGDGREQNAFTAKVLFGPCDETRRPLHVGRLATDERFQRGTLVWPERAHPEVEPDRFGVGGDRRLSGRVASGERASPVFDPELARDVAEHIGLDLERSLAGEPAREPDEGDLVGESEPGVVVPQASDLGPVLVGELGLTREGRACRVR